MPSKSKTYDDSSDESGDLNTSNYLNPTENDEVQTEEHKDNIDKYADDFAGKNDVNDEDNENQLYQPMPQPKTKRVKPSKRRYTQKKRFMFKKTTSKQLQFNCKKFLKYFASENNVYGIYHDIYDTTYGEISIDSISNIFNNIDYDKTDVLYDLGSGRGQFIYYCNFVYNLSTVGIEIINERYNVAKNIGIKIKLQKNKLSDEISIFKNKANNQSITFILDDFNNVDFSDGTIFYLCNTIWGDDTTNKILQKIIDESDNLKHIIITTNTKTPPDNIFLDKIIRCSFSWSENSKVYIYSVN